MEDEPEEGLQNNEAIFFTLGTVLILLYLQKIGVFHIHI